MQEVPSLGHGLTSPGSLLACRSPVRRPRMMTGAVMQDPTMAVSLSTCCRLNWSGPVSHSVHFPGLLKAQHQQDIFRLLTLSFSLSVLR